MLRPQRSQQSNPAQRASENPDVLQSIGVAFYQVGLLLSGRHQFEEFNNLRGICRPLLGLRGDGGVAFDLMLDAILENCPAYSNANALSRCPEEREQTNSVSLVHRRRSRLNGKHESCRQHARAEAHDERNDYPAGCASVHVEEDHESEAQRREVPACPEGPPVFAHFGDNGADHDGCWGGGEAGGEEVYAGVDGAMAFDGLEVEGLVEEAGRVAVSLDVWCSDLEFDGVDTPTPHHKPVDEVTQVCHAGTATFEHS